ncbi:DUF2723 domain-containing protein [Chloroflexota bacterium]
MKNIRKRQELGGALICALGALALYLLTLAPTVQGFDSAELTMGAFDLGFVHPSGYPLYLVLGRLFSRLPIGDVGWRLNLMSAIFGALAGGLLFSLIYRLGKDFGSALVATALFCSAPLYWSQAIRAEVYSLHIFLMAAALYIWLLAHQKENRRLYILGFVLLGLGLANHLTSVLLWAAFLAAATWITPKLRRATLPAALVGLALAGLVYLYFPWRAQAPLQVDYIRPYFHIDLATPGGLWWMVSGKAFQCLLLPIGRAYNPWGEIIKLAALIWEQSLGFGLLLAAWGWLTQNKENRRWNRTLTIYFLGNLVMFVAYNAIDKEVMFLPIYLVISIWAGSGIINLANWIKEALRKVELSQGRALPINTLLNIILGLVILAGILSDWRTVSLREDRRAYDFAGKVLDQVGPEATIVNHWATASVFDYLRIVEGRRPDVANINVDFYFLAIQQDCQPVTNQTLVASGWIDQLVDLTEQERLCFIEPLHGLPDGFEWQEQGPCWGLVAEDGQ